VFDIKPTVDVNLNATLVFTYLSDELNGIAANQLQLIRSTNNGVKWLSVPSYVLNNANNTITKTGIDAFSLWTASDVTGSLPVTLVAFNGAVLKNRTTLNWSTASEVNNKGFWVEESADGKTFTSLAWVNGNGTTNALHHYNYSTIYFKPTYYRLKQVDFDGRVEYSEVILVGLKESAGVVSIHPNPITADSKVEYSLNNTTAITLNLANMQGQTLATFQGAVADATQWLQKAQTVLKPGAYLVTGAVDNTPISIKLLK